MSTAYNYNPLATKPLHTRYSELKLCSNPTSALKVAMRRLEWLKKADTTAMQFGRVRHEMFEKETKKTGRAPEIVQSILGVGGFEAEVYMAVKIWGVGVLHGTIDLLSRRRNLIIDYKITQGGSSFDKRQLMIYQLLCQESGIEIDVAGFVQEIWSDDKAKLLDHGTQYYDFEDDELKDTKGWLRKRAKLLRGAIDLVRPAA